MKSEFGMVIISFRADVYKAGGLGGLGGYSWNQQDATPEYREIIMVSTLVIFHSNNAASFAIPARHVLVSSFLTEEL